MPLKTDIDPTDDVPRYEADITVIVVRHLAAGVPPTELLHQFAALASVSPCDTTTAGRAALHVGGRLIVAATERPSNAPIH